MAIRRKGAHAASGVIYSLVPAQPLPTVDLSKSFRGRLLPASLHTYIRRRYYKYHKPIMICAALSYCLNLLVSMVRAPVGRILAVVAVLLWAPSGFGSVTTLRYDIVRLVIRTFDFWFFSVATSAVVITMSVYFSDLRWVRMLINWFGFHHAIFVDAHVLGLRHITYILIFGMISVAIVFVWIMFGQIDDISTFSIMKYENIHGGFELIGLDVMSNGVVSLGFLLIKIIFHRRKTLRLRRKRSSSLVECVLYRCRLKLEAVEELEASLASVIEVSRFDSKEPSLREPDIVQHLLFVKFPQRFDATITFFPWQGLRRVFLPKWLVTILYCVGATGLLLSQGALFHEFSDSNETASHEQFDLLVAWSALLCTALFTASFAVFYQRQLLQLLLRSFDFAFYSFQITSANLCVGCLYNWDTPHCLMALAWWLWAHWVFTLDALTPVMREMFKFRVRFAAPIVCLLLVDHVALMYRILVAGDTRLQDSVIWEGTVWSQHLTFRVIPFYVSRSLTLVLWSSRFVVRLASASNDDVAILRGAVCYDNFFARGRRTSSQITQVLEVKTLAALSKRTLESSIHSVHPWHHP
jgi:hypothetical protein